ncbi:MAG: prepilin-type N-terminal cleavage/methylation domain-containing protein [Candidatus Falkowbacteria bacterium]|nr:prepilin-type N-terminal cleavage/methylation domain-containing protein [Candidatus Falkowbacteria bacterium]
MKLGLSQLTRKVQSATKNKSAFTIVEILLAVAIFALLVTAFSGVYLYGQEASAMAGGRTRADLLAQEGLEAVQNMRDSAFANLTDGTYGLAISGGKWILSGTQDVLDNFTRSVTISTVDANRKNVVSTVNWQQNTQRAGSVSLVTRLTNWIATVASSVSGALIIYGDGTNIPKYRTYDSATNVFSAETSALTNSVAPNFIIRTSPNKSEAIAGFYTAAGVLNVMCYNGSTWSQEWTATVGGTGAGRRFDIAYETASGDVMVLYSTNTATTNELAYRTKLGGSGCGSANWAAPANLDALRTSNIINYIRLAWDRRTGQNLIAATWVDINDDLSGAIWNGSAWTNEPSTVSDTNVEMVSISHDLEDMDIEYESLSGDVMMIWGSTVGNNANGVRYRTCNGGIASCTWSSVITPPTFNDDATTLDISANPSTDEMVFASIGANQSDLQLGYWSGSTWTNTANADTSCNTPFAGSKLVSTGWLISGATARSVITYADQNSNNIDWYVGNLGVFTKQADMVVSPLPNNPNGYYDIQMDALARDQLMFVLADASLDLFAKRLVMTATPVFTWTNSDGAPLEVTLPQNISSPFGFAFWRN